MLYHRPQVDGVLNGYLFPTSPLLLGYEAHKSNSRPESLFLIIFRARRNMSFIM